MRIVHRLIGRQRHRSPVRSRDLDVLVPLLAMDRAAVEVEVNVIVFDPHKRDVRRIAGPDGRSP